MSDPLEVEIFQLRNAIRWQTAYCIFFFRSNPHCFIAVRNILRKGGRATPYSDSGYAVERTELRSTAQLGHLYGSRSGTLRLGSLRCRAYLAELYSVARKAVRDSSSSSTAYRHAPYGIAHLPVRTATFGQEQIRISTLVRSKQKQDTPQ